jgi:hypothetical protein
MDEVEQLKAEVARLTSLIEGSKKALRYVLATIKLSTAERVVIVRTINAFGEDL